MDGEVPFVVVKVDVFINVVVFIDMEYVPLVVEAVL